LEKIIDIIESIAHEKGLKMDDVKDVVAVAVVKTAKRAYGEEYEYEAEIDEKNKTLKLFQKVTVVSNEEKTAEEENENIIGIDEAKEIDPEIEIGDELTYELPLEGLGRSAAATLQRELEFHLQRLLERDIFEKYKNKIKQIVTGTVIRIDNEENTYIEIDEVRAILPKKNRIKGEKFKIGDVVKAVIRRVYIDKSLGIQVELSRTTPLFLEELLKLEVPEINDGIVLIHKSARIPGERAKVALSSINPRVDPVGATVGTKGVRINAVSKELCNENIDCIEYSPVGEIFLARALSPAIITSIKIEENIAKVTIPSDQKSKAIGKSGINIRLASMLTGYEIELIEQKETEAAQKDISALKALFGE
jgi:N utilization substance protein A